MKFAKPYVHLLFLLLTFVACNSNLKKEVVEYYDNGSIKKENFYTLSGDKKDVIKEIQFYENGSKKLVGHYKNGKKDGKWTFWYVNGEKQSEGYFIQNVRTGETIVYHENGNLFYKGNYTEGQKDKEWTFYNNNGKAINIIVFDNGTIVTQKKPKKVANKTTE